MIRLPLSPTIQARNKLHFYVFQSDLREKFSELARAEPHLGLDPQAPSLEDPSSTLENERFALGRKVLAANHAPMSQEFLKKGLLFWIFLAF